MTAKIASKEERAKCIRGILASLEQLKYSDDLIAAFVSDKAAQIGQPFCSPPIGKQWMADANEGARDQMVEKVLHPIDMLILSQLEKIEMLRAVGNLWKNRPPFEVIQLVAAAE